MNIENESLPVQDDVQVDGQTEQELLDAVMANSMLADAAGINDAPPLPDEEMEEVDPVEYEDEDPESEYEAVTEDDEEEVYEDDDADVGEDDDNSTQPDVYTADDLDLDALVTVKVDGEEMDVSFADLIKGYQTDAHLSKKGRELSEAQQAVEAEREERLNKLTEMGAGVEAMLTQQEQYYAKQYHDIEAKIDEARKEGDTYEVNELKDKREQAQKNYHTARQRREGMMGAIAEQQQAQMQEHWDAQVKHFTETIPTMIPDFDESVAQDIRQFAIDEGINPDVLDTIVDPAIVKFVDDYRRLKQGVSKGKAKRKAVPAKKGVPSRKATPAQKKKADAETRRKQKVMSGKGTQKDEMDFLRDYASRSLNNL